MAQAILDTIVGQYVDELPCNSHLRCNHISKEDKDGLGFHQVDKMVIENIYITGAAGLKTTLQTQYVNFVI